jgi:archaellum component FlaC
MFKYKPDNQLQELKETIDTMKQILIKMDNRLNNIENEIKYIKKHINT